MTTTTITVRANEQRDRRDVRDADVADVAAVLPRRRKRWRTENTHSLSLGGGRILTLSFRRGTAAAGMGMGSEEVVEKHCISVSAAYKSQNVCLDENVHSLAPR